MGNNKLRSFKLKVRNFAIEHEEIDVRKLLEPQGKLSTIFFFKKDPFHPNSTYKQPFPKLGRHGSLCLDHSFQPHLCVADPSQSSVLLHDVLLASGTCGLQAL